MIVDIEESLDHYLDTADGIAAEVRRENGPVLDLLRDFHSYFARKLWRGDNGLPPAAAMLSMSAFLTYLAGIRVAISGHAAAVFPVLRTALESACYAYLIAKSPELAEVWLRRHDDGESLKSCRRAFDGAVRKVAADVDREQAGGGAWLLEAYEVAIDFGAHPNIKGVVGHARMEEEVDDDPFLRVSIAGLYGADHWQTFRGLVACADYALAIAVVLTRALASPDAVHQEELQRLNDRKNALAGTLSD